jgi:predicted component of type VI protein secretion system
MGDSNISTQTSDTIPYTVPSAPVINSIKAVNPDPNSSSRFDASSDSTKCGETIEISFTPSTNIGKTGDIITYKVSAVPVDTPNVEAKIATGTISPIRLGGLINGTNYNCTMVAINTVGSSLVSNIKVGLPQGKPKAAKITSLSIKEDWTEFTITALVPKPDNTVYNVFGNGTIKYTLHYFTKTINNANRYNQPVINIQPSSDPNYDIYTLKAINTSTNNILNESISHLNGLTSFYIKSENDLCWRDDYLKESNNEIIWIKLGKPEKPVITNVTDNQNGSVTIKYDPSSGNGTYGESGIKIYPITKYTVKTSFVGPKASSLPDDVVSLVNSPIPLPISYNTGSTGTYTSTGTYITNNPITVKGLIPGYKYKFSLFSTNNKNINSDSFISSEILISTKAPNPPTDIFAKFNTNNTVSVSFTPPKINEGTPITQYNLKANGELVSSGNSSPIYVSGLELGKNYTFTVSSYNGIDSDDSSSVSILLAKIPNTIDKNDISVTPDENKIKLNIKVPETNGSPIKKVNINAYYNDPVNKGKYLYETITTISDENLNKGDTKTVLLDTNKKYNLNIPLPTGKTSFDQLNNQEFNSLFTSKNLKKTLDNLSFNSTGTFEPYSHVKLKNDNKKRKDNKLYIFIFFVILGILYYWLNNSRKSIKNIKYTKY